MTKGLDERWSDNIIPHEEVGSLIERLGIQGNHYGTIPNDLDLERENDPTIAECWPNSYLYIDCHIIR